MEKTLLVVYNKAIEVNKINLETLTYKVIKMIQQTLLPFKIEKTDDRITPHSGLALLLGEFIAGTKVLETIDAYLPELGKCGVQAIGIYFSANIILNPDCAFSFRFY